MCPSPPRLVCPSQVNNGGSDGKASSYVVIDNVRLNDYYWDTDAALVGKLINGNYECKGHYGYDRCCFCKPNGIRASQVSQETPIAFCRCCRRRRRRR